MLRVYDEWRATGRRTAVKNVSAHGCYCPGIPLLIDGTDVTRDGLHDLRALRTALASSLRRSRIAIVVSPSVSAPDETFTLDGAVFTSREDALRWLTASEQ